MKILLIIPRYLLTDKPNYEYSFPLGLAYISASMKKQRYEVDCLNLNHLNGKIDKILTRKLKLKNYEIICTGHIGIGYRVLEKIIQTIRDYSSNSKIILGGAIITPEPKLIFESLKPDYAVIGEGETTIIELLKTIKNKTSPEKVNGIIFKKDKKTIITKPREAIKNIDELPIPDFEGMDFEKQLNNMSANNSPYGLFDYPRVYPIMCSRGCPFQCTFCYHCLGIRYRERSIENVMQELRKNVKKYQINLIALYDDLFSINKERLYKFCDEIKNLIKELDWECKWTCQLSVRNIDDEMLKKLKEAGCYAVSFGFESYSQKVLNSMKKPITPELIDRAINLTKKHKMIVQGNFIFGDRAETKETAKTTLDYWKKNCSEQIYLGFIQPYPGSEIYNHCIKKEIIKDKLDFIKNHMNETNWFNMTDNMTDSEVLELKKDILEARRKYSSYVVPTKFKKEKKHKRYSLLIKCPGCKKKMIYKNFFIEDKLVFTQWSSCKNCKRRFNIASPLYKIGVQNHKRINFLKNIYLSLRENISKRNL
ncbi:radical SAM protein [archaeon]|nr:radical SAM protein [archaeon]